MVRGPTVGTDDNGQLGTCDLQARASFGSSVTRLSVASNDEVYDGAFSVTGEVRYVGDNSRACGTWASLVWRLRLTLQPAAG